MSLAFEFVGAVFLFWLVGRLIDDRFDTEPWFQVTGALVGWVGGFLHVYYRTKGVDWQGVPGTRRPAAGTTTGVARKQEQAAAKEEQAAPGTQEQGGPDVGARTDTRARADDGDGLGGQR